MFKTLKAKLNQQKKLKLEVQTIVKKFLKTMTEKCQCQNCANLSVNCQKKSAKLKARFCPL